VNDRRVKKSSGTRCREKERRNTLSGGVGQKRRGSMFRVAIAIHAGLLYRGSEPNHRQDNGGRMGRTCRKKREETL